MPNMDSTFKPGEALTNTKGQTTPVLAVEFLAADPTLVAGVPRIWVNTTSGVLKFTHNGTTTRTVTAT